jgi:DNA-binding NarL/FixJ family response regulator
LFEDSWLEANSVYVREFISIEETAVLSIRAVSRRLAVCAISKHPGLITTLERLLGREPFKMLPLRVVRDGSNGSHHGLWHDPEHLHLPHASVFVLDGNSINLGMETLIERIRAESPNARLLVVKETLRDEKVFPYLRLGVRGVVRYIDAETDLANAVKSVATGDFWIEQKQLVRFVDWLLSTPTYHSTMSEPGTLSRREREVLISILNGLTNKEIASELHISERTVKFHVSRLFQKFGAQRRADLIAKQYQLWPVVS